MNIDSRGTIISQESMSTCGTNNSAFFRVDIEPNEMKYSMSDMSISGLVNSFTRSRSYGENTNEGRSDSETFVVNTPPPCNTNDVRRALTMSRSNSQLIFAIPSYQRPNPSISDNEHIYATPFNAETIFRQQTRTVESQDEGHEESAISQANPVESNNSDGTPQQSELVATSANSKTESMMKELPLVLYSKQDKGESQLIPYDGLVNDKYLDVSSIELQFAEPSQPIAPPDNKVLLEKARSQITTSNSTRTSCLTSETVICEEEEEEAKTSDQGTSNTFFFDGMLAKLRSQNSSIAEQFNSMQTSIASFCSQQVSSIASTCQVCDGSCFDNSSSWSQKTPNNSCINEETIAVEQWARKMNYKVSELSELVKYGSISALNSAKNCGATSMNDPSKTKSKSIVDNLMDDNSLVEPKRMIDKKLYLSEECQHSGEISLGSSHIDESTSSLGESASLSNLALKKAGMGKIVVSTNVADTEKFIKEIDQYAANLGIDRAEFLSKIASMIKENNEEPDHRRHSMNGMQDILEIFTTSCNPSNLSTGENSCKQNIASTSSQTFDEVEGSINGVYDEDEEEEGSGMIISAISTNETELNSISTAKSPPDADNNDFLQDGSSSETNQVIENSGKNVNEEQNISLKGNNDKDNGAPNTFRSIHRIGDSYMIAPTKNSRSVNNFQGQILKIHRRVGLGNVKSTTKNVNRQSSKFVQKGRFRLMK